MEVEKDGGNKESKRMAATRHSAQVAGAYDCKQARREERAAGSLMMPRGETTSTRSLSAVKDTLRRSQSQKDTATCLDHWICSGKPNRGADAH